MGYALRRAAADLGLDHGRVGFDDLAFGLCLGLDGAEAVDGYDPLMFARAVKTGTELRLLERSTRLKEKAIRRTMAAWEPGATWGHLKKGYAVEVCEIGTHACRESTCQYVYISEVAQPF